MRNRKLAMGVVAAAIFGAGIGVSILPASAPADPRTLVVTLATGQTVTVTVDVPPGTPIDQIPIPGITTPIVGVSEVPSPPATTDQPPVAVSTDQQPPPAPATPDSPTAAPQNSDRARDCGDAVRARNFKWRSSAQRTPTGMCLCCHVRECGRV